MRSGTNWPAPGRGAGCEVHDVSPGSTLLARLPSSGLTVGQARGTTCPVLSLPATRSEFVEALPRNLARALTTTFSRLEGEGPVSVERATPDTLREFVEALISLHEQRWTRRASHGMLSVPAVRAFHRAAAPRLMDGGWLGVWGLRLGGRLVAVLYALRARQRLMGYLTGFDDALKSFSPGSVVVGHAMLDAIDEGYREFDFLRGSESYKYRWGARDRWLCNLSITRPGTTAA